MTSGGPDKDAGYVYIGLDLGTSGLKAAARRDDRAKSGISPRNPPFVSGVTG